MSRTCNSNQAESVAQPMLDDLLDRIRSGELEGGDRIGTEVGLARRHGISRMTVRRALKPWADRGLIERRPGKGLFVGAITATATVEVVVPSFDHDQWINVWRGIRDHSADIDARVQLQAYDAHGSMDRHIEHIRRLPDTPVAGAIIGLLSHPRFSEAIYGLKRLSFPFVLVDAPLTDLQVSAVYADHYGGGYGVGRELIAMGHRRIAFVGNLGYYTTRQRCDGLRDAMLDASLTCDRSLMADLGVEDPLGDWRPAIRQAVRDLMGRESAPTAIFVNNDAVAVTVYEELRAMGLGIPQDVSVVGFGGQRIAQLLDPPLATMVMDNVAIGARAMEMLLERLRPGFDEEAQPRQEMIENRWLARASLGRARGEGCGA